MKCLVTAVAILCWSLVANAAEKLSFSGQFRLRNLNDHIYEGRSNRLNITQLRFRSKFDYEVSEELHVVLTPQGVKDFGELGYRYQSDDSHDEYLTSGDKHHKDLEFFEAYAEGRREWFRYKLGRQTLAYGDNLVLGSRNWTPSGVSFDAFKFVVELGDGELHMVNAKVSQGLSGSRTEDDKNLSFLYYKIIQEEGLELDAYYLYDQGGTANGTSDVSALGLRYKQGFGLGDIYFEQVVQDSSALESTEYSTNFEAGAQFGSARYFLYYALNSADYDHLYTNRHAYNGIIDIVGRRNVETISLGVEADMNEALAFKAEVLHFNKQQRGRASYILSTESTLQGDDTKRNLGNELDLRLFYSLSENEGLEAAYAAFLHGDFFQEQETSYLFYLEYLIRF